VDERDPPTIVDGLTTGKAFKIVGNPADLARGRDDDWNALERRCARAGPVLRPSEDQPGEDFFFGGFSERHDLKAVEVSFAARSLALAITSSPRDASPLSCVEDPAEPAGNLCGDPRTILAGLDLGRLRYLEVKPCADRPATRCAEAWFDRGGGRGSWEQRILSLKIATDTLVIDPPPDRIAIRSVTISAFTVSD
jgi:hypothetical protein